MSNNEQLNTIYPEGYEFNLSDFALFLSVMRYEEAFKCVLSIILDEPDVEMESVHVENVLLNKSGMRAIRLDAWGKTSDGRHIDMEMENTADGSEITKRARYYQSLIDSPILKSGKKTKYKLLPPTIIIFITQEDIFGKDLARYTFKEKCEEIEDLWLDDGTTKIFLNMTSKNGSKELVSLLQYMKQSNLDNDEIAVKDDRILRLDKIVREVKESEEWEEVQMTIYDLGIEKGIEQGIEKERISMIETMLSDGRSIEEIAEITHESEEAIKKIKDAMAEKV